jgi:hypothetical protein
METIWNARRMLLVLFGLLAGVLASTLVGGLADASSKRAAADSEPFVEATHLPPLLTVAGEQPVLRYDVYCDSEDPPGEDGCAASGSVFVRAGDRGPFQEVPLVRNADAGAGRYSAHVPADIARSRDGFSYYAVIRSLASNATATTPAAGASAPERSLPLGRPVEIRLGAHTFGAVATASARVAEAAWGDGPGDAGLEQGRNQTPVGGSSFDVSSTGEVTILDEAHRRLLRYRPGASRAPARIPVAINGTIADLALADDGSAYVLETTAEPDRAPVVRKFTSDGRAAGATPTAGRGASQLRPGPAGPVALDDTTSMWMPVFDAGAQLSPNAQRRRARPGRPLPGGDEVVVLRTGDEIRAALVGPKGVRQSWRVTSETPIAEVQLAEPFANRLVLVVRAYTDWRAEFVALVLGPRGIEQRRSLDAADWAETAPLSRFRLVGSSLYRLGSTPAGLFVDRFDLEVR